MGVALVFGKAGLASPRVARGAGAWRFGPARVTVFPRRSLEAWLIAKQTRSFPLNSDPAAAQRGAQSCLPLGLPIPAPSCLRPEKTRVKVECLPLSSLAAGRPGLSCEIPETRVGAGHKGGGPPRRVDGGLPVEQKEPPHLLLGS